MIVVALYDFSGEPSSSELTIKAGEQLTVVNQAVGEGWWEGVNSVGKRGLFPAAYVEKYVPAAIPPPPMSALPAVPSNNNNGAARYDQTADDGWNEQDDDWDNEQDDDWDDENPHRYSEITTPAANNNNPPSSQPPTNFYQNAQQLPSPPADDTLSIASHNMSRKGTKIFSKSSDSYILGTVTVAVSEQERVRIYPSDQGYFWQQIESPYSVIVASPKKETKFKGMKSFIAYQLTPSFNNDQVSRRYKHFDWLHEQLVKKFVMIPIPPLPDKQISGRYEDQFVEHRRVQLQEFVDWVCRHPVLSTCEVWMHFLTCKDEKKWKQGKRQAEKDPLVGATYCAALFPPEKQLLQSQVDSQTDTCVNFVHHMDGAVKTLEFISNDQSKKYSLQYRKDYQRIGEGLSDLAKSLEIDERRAVTNICLSNSVGHVAGIFISVGKMFEDQPKRDWQPFSDRLHIYRGILGNFPDILGEHKNAMQKRKECEKLTAEQKMGNAQLQEVNRRTDIMSYALMAELTHFRSERDTHLKQTIKELIASQIEFFQNIVSKLQTAQQYFD